MRVCLSLAFLCATWRWGNWRNWRTHHATILYFVLSGLLYDVLFCNYPMWEYEPSFFLPNHTLTSILNTFVAFPCTVLLYLAHYPAGLVKQLAYVLMWAGIYAGIEFFAVQRHLITYYHGWTFWWSVAFDVAIFVMLKIHSRHPLLAYSISAVEMIALIILFRVPVAVMK